MSEPTGAGGSRGTNWLPHTRRHFRRDRQRRQIGPVVKALEGRLLLAGTSPTNPVPIGPGPNGTPTSQQLGAAYQQVVAIETVTLQSLGESYREVEAAGTRLASRMAAAIGRLNSELSQVKGQHQADAIAAAMRRDRHILNLGGAHTVRVEQGLDVARGLADQQATSDKVDVPNHLLTTLELVRQDRTTGAAIARSGRRSAEILVRKLDVLGDELASTVSVRIPR